MCRSKKHKLENSIYVTLVLRDQANIGHRKSVTTNEISLFQGNTNFPKIYGPTQNFWRHNDDRKEVPYQVRKILDVITHNFVANTDLFNKG